VEGPAVLPLVLTHPLYRTLHKEREGWGARRGYSLKPLPAGDLISYVLSRKCIFQGPHWESCNRAQRKVGTAVAKRLPGVLT
jgi:hypothetical protein